MFNYRGVYSMVDSMTPYEQLELLKKNISNVKDPALLMLMNAKARELQEQIEKIKTMQVYICQN